jgi:hypothetical protein
MAQQSSILPDPAKEFDHHVVRFPTRYTSYAPVGLSVPSGARPSQGQHAQITSRSTRQITVLEVAGLDSGVAKDLDQSIQLALGEGPRGVICDLTAAVGDAESEAVEVLAAAGRYVRDWPGICVAVAGADHRVREVLAADQLGQHLILTESLPSALSALLSAPIPAVERLRLTPRPTAPRASREFVTRTLLDWGLSRTIPFATLVVSELVTSSTIHAGTDIDLTVVWDQGMLRLMVRDHDPAAMGPVAHDTALQGRGLTVVAGLSRAFGVLPGADGGKVVWAVLKAPAVPPRPAPSLTTFTAAP